MIEWHPSPLHHLKWHRMCLGCSNCVMQGLVVIMLHNNAAIPLAPAPALINVSWQASVWQPWIQPGPPDWDNNCHHQRVVTNQGLAIHDWHLEWRVTLCDILPPFFVTGPIVHLSLSRSCKQNVSPLSRKQFAGHCKINSEKEKAEEKITLWPFLVLSLFSAWCFS